MRIIDWSSDVFSADLIRRRRQHGLHRILLRREGGEGGGVGGAALDIRRGADFARLLHRLGVEQIALDAIFARFGVDRGDRHRRFLLGHQEIGRASWRERVGQYVEISVVAGALKKKKKNKK